MVEDFQTGCKYDNIEIKHRDVERHLLINTSAALSSTKLNRGIQFIAGVKAPGHFRIEASVVRDATLSVASQQGIIAGCCFQWSEGIRGPITIAKAEVGLSRQGDLSFEIHFGSHSYSKISGCACKEAHIQTGSEVCTDSGIKVDLDVRWLRRPTDVHRIKAIHHPAQNPGALSMECKLPTGTNCATI